MVMGSLGFIWDVPVTCIPQPHSDGMGLAGPIGLAGPVGPAMPDGPAGLIGLARRVGPEDEEEEEGVG